jgi:hypothetical protein
VNCFTSHAHLMLRECWGIGSWPGPMQPPPLDPDVADLAPATPTLTAYDEPHAITYLRMLDADAEGANWREVSRIVLRSGCGGLSRAISRERNRRRGSGTVNCFDEGARGPLHPREVHPRAFVRRKLAKEYLERYPKDRYQTEVESWRKLQSDNIEFTMKRLREPLK